MMIKRCFVVGPIGADGSQIRDHADWLLEQIIEPVFRQHYADFDLKRSDRITTPGMIDSQMINRLLEDDLVIADLSLLNPNAFYEIGIRHMIGKPIVHMFLEGTEIPFDIKPYRAISFSLRRSRDLEIARQALLAALKEVLVEGYEVENPVTRARGKLSLDLHATPEVKLLSSQMESIQRQIDEVKRQRNYSQSTPILTNQSHFFNFKIEIIPKKREYVKYISSSLEEIVKIDGLSFTRLAGANNMFVSGFGKDRLYAKRLAENISQHFGEKIREIIVDEEKAT